MPSVCDIDTGTLFESKSCYRNKTAFRDILTIYVLGDDNVVDISSVQFRSIMSPLANKWSNKVTHVKGTNYVLVGRSAHCLVSVYGSAKPSAARAFFLL